MVAFRLRSRQWIVDEDGDIGDEFEENLSFVDIQDSSGMNLVKQSTPSGNKMMPSQSQVDLIKKFEKLNEKLSISEVSAT